MLIGGGEPNDDSFIGPMARYIKAFLLSPFVSHEFHFFVADIRKEDLALLRDLMQAGKLKPVIDGTFKLSETAAAITDLGAGRAKGKSLSVRTKHARLRSPVRNGGLPSAHADLGAERTQRI